MSEPRELNWHDLLIPKGTFSWLCLLQTTQNLYLKTMTFAFPCTCLVLTPWFLPFYISYMSDFKSDLQSAEWDNETQNDSLKGIYLTVTLWSMARFKTWKIPEGLYLSWPVEDSNSHILSDTHWNACLRPCSWSSLMRQALGCQIPIIYKSQKTQKGRITKINISNWTNKLIKYFQQFNVRVSITCKRHFLFYKFKYMQVTPTGEQESAE